MCVYLNDSTNEDNIGIASLIIFVLFAILFFSTDSSGATTDMVLDKTLCNLYGYVTGPPGKTAASLGIGVTAAGAMFGKMSPSTAVVITMSCAAMLGSGQIAMWLVDDDSDEGFICKDNE